MGISRDDKLMEFACALWSSIVMVLLFQFIMTDWLNILQVNTLDATLILVFATLLEYRSRINFKKNQEEGEK